MGSDAQFSDVDPAVRELVDMLAEHPGSFEAAVHVILHCLRREDVSHVLEAARRMTAVDGAHAAPLKGVLLDFFDSQNNRVISDRKGQFVELLVSLVGPLRRGLPFSESRHCTGFFQGRRICDTAQNADIAFCLRSGDSESFEVYECKLSVLSQDGASLREGIPPKLKYLATMKDFLEQRGYDIDVALVTLNGDEEFVREILRSESSANIALIGAQSIRNLLG